MRIIFMGSPEFAVKALEKIISIKGVTIPAVFSQPAKPKGRGMQLIDTPVTSFAKSKNIEVFTPKTLRNEEQVEIIKSFEPDLIIVAAYGLILPKTVLDIPKYGVINIHASILPRWRGAAPIHHAILAGDEYSGVTIMQMDEGLDTGGMIKISEHVPITDKTKLKDLHDSLAEIGSKLMVEVIEDIIRTGKAQAFEKQDDSLATYAHKISKDQLKLDFNQSAKDIIRKINALSELGSYITLKGENVKILDAEIVEFEGDFEPKVIASKDLIIKTLDGFIQPNILQKPGKGAVSRKDFLNGIREDLTGTILE
ncbi:MAG: methionyl-tRNA formyltransferase [Alphaproteobacteria bacterium 33-17]|nr:MAG: methionyl-tRNA formyltransferase [Alphaproteobacteria bacterium 33-17]